MGMDTTRTALETGVITMVTNVAEVMDSNDVVQKVGATMPLPDKDISSKTKRIAEWLSRFDKKKYMFLTPEMSLIEELGRICGDTSEAIIVIPSNLDEDAKERLKNNVPRNIKVSILEEPFFPQSIYPGNGIMVICGYSGGGRAMILSDTFRMLEHYTGGTNGFYGKKVFIPYVEVESASRYDGWMEISDQRINDRWRCDYE